MTSYLQNLTPFFVNSCAFKKTIQDKYLDKVYKEEKEYGII